jgi:hypothetical protein
MHDPDKALVEAIAFALRSLDPWPRASDVNLPSWRLAEGVAEHLRRCGYVIARKAPDPFPDTGRLMGGPAKPERDGG